VVDVDPSKLREGEYLVIGTPRIEIPPIPVEEKNAIMTFSFRQIQVRVDVKNQDDPRYELYASAERVRNYLAYVLLLRLPMIFDMIGKRRIPGQWSPFPFPAVYEGGTHLPLTDGGNGDISVFKTGFGPPEGEPPPLNARQSLGALTNWHTALNRSLARVQQLLDRIPVLTAQDDAMNLFGQAIWAEEARGRFADSWRVVEAVAKHDFSKPKASPRMIFDTIKKRTKKSVQMDRFLQLRMVRNAVTHSSALQVVSKDVHQGADQMLRIAHEVLQSLLKDTGFEQISSGA
jgi:hypothetical protein